MSQKCDLTCSFLEHIVPFDHKIISIYLAEQEGLSSFS